MGPEGEGQMSETMEKKIVNDAAAYIRSLAESHGRNADWAEDAVRKAVSITEQEALELNVIDMTAPTLDALISQLDGREVTLLDGRMVTLNTQDITVNRIGMNVVENFLYAIADPNIAFILLSLAILGISVEIFNPGLIFPGIIGAISGIFAFYSLGQLPVNIAGVLLIVLAFGLFIGEVLTTTFGLFTAGGLVSLIVGSLILFQGGSPLFRVDPWLIAIVAIFIGGFFAFAVQKIIRTYRRQAFTGREELIGKKAIVRVALNPEGTVFFKGEHWTAISEQGRIEPREEVIITSVDGLQLYVTRKETSEDADK